MSKAKEMFFKYGYEQVSNNENYIEYRDYGHGDGDYSYIKFCLNMRDIEIGYYDGYGEKRFEPYYFNAIEIPMILEQSKELGWYHDDK